MIDHECPKCGEKIELKEDSKEFSCPDCERNYSVTIIKAWQIRSGLGDILTNVSPIVTDFHVVVQEEKLGLFKVTPPYILREFYDIKDKRIEA